MDRYTPMLLALIERAGISDYDEAMELYLNTCERLSAGDCARLRRYDPAKGPLAAWLGVVVRNVMVDWVRSRAGRRRIFRAVETLPRRELEVFELYYWEDRSPSEICELLSTRAGRLVRIGDVLDALDAIDAVLSERHRRELLAMAVRSRTPVSLEAELEKGGAEPRAPAIDPESALLAKEAAASLNAALRSLPPEDAAIVRLKYVHGLTHRDIQRALHLERLTDIDDRVKAISARLRALLSLADAAMLDGAAR